MKSAVGSALAFALERASEGLVSCDDLTAIGLTRTQGAARLSSWHHSRLFALVDRDEVMIYRLSSKGREIWGEIQRGERSVRDDGKMPMAYDFTSLIDCLRTALPTNQLRQEPTWLELCR